jgi:hypothetical protein
VGKVYAPMGERDPAGNNLALFVTGPVELIRWEEFGSGNVDQVADIRLVA